MVVKNEEVNEMTKRADLPKDKKARTAVAQRIIETANEIIAERRQKRLNRRPKIRLERRVAESGSHREVNHGLTG